MSLHTITIQFDLDNYTTAYPSITKNKIIGHFRNALKEIHIHSIEISGSENILAISVTNISNFELCEAVLEIFCNKFDEILPGGIRPRLYTATKNKE